jgi:hypothetical protein
VENEKDKDWEARFNIPSFHVSRTVRGLVVLAFVAFILIAHIFERKGSFPLFWIFAAIVTVLALREIYADQRGSKPK